MSIIYKSFMGYWIGEDRSSLRL